MKNYVILLDTSCDMSKELCARFDIETIKGHITLPDGTEDSSDCEWTTSPKEFYNSLKNKNAVYTTCPPSVGEYVERFEQIIQRGCDIIVMSISSGMSGTYNFTLQAKDEVLEKYPDAKIFCIDSLRYSTGFGILGVYASMLRKEGKTIEETVMWVEENKKRVHQMGWLDDLKFIAAKGRISHAKAFMGSLIGVKPLGEFDYTGMTTVLGKAKGEKNAFNAIIEYIDKTIENPSEQIIFIAQTDREDKALILKQKIQEKFNPKEIIMTTVYKYCGINIGPGLMAAFYFGKPISKDLSVETALMEEILN